MPYFFSSIIPLYGIRALLFFGVISPYSLLPYHIMAEKAKIVNAQIVILNVQEPNEPFTQPSFISLIKILSNLPPPITFYGNSKLKQGFF